MGGWGFTHLQPAQEQPQQRSCWSLIYRDQDIQKPLCRGTAERKPTCLCHCSNQELKEVLEIKGKVCSWQTGSTEQAGAFLAAEDQEGCGALPEITSISLGV